MRKKHLKFLAFLLCLTTLMTTISFSPLVSLAVDPVVYVSSTGSDSNSGTESSPFATLDKAVQTIGAANNGTVIVSGSVPYVNNKTAHTGTITYKGATTSDEITFNGVSIILNGPSIFEDLTLNQNGNYKSLNANGKNVTLRGTINYRMSGSEVMGFPKLCFVSGPASDFNANLNAGTYYGAYIGGEGNITGTANIVVDGATSLPLYIGARTGTSYSVNNLNITYNSGTVTSLATTAYLSSFTGNLQVICNNNTSIPTITLGVSPAGGQWYVNSAATDGSMLSATATPGTFAVSGGKTAYAYSANGTRVYYSKDGYLTLPAGTSTIHYASDFSTSTPQLPDGYALWQDNGAGVLTASLGSVQETHVFDDYINYRKPLQNTYAKLVNDNALKIVYFGGSVTNGYGSSDANRYSWRALTTSWFQDNFPDATITAVNAACGESGTYLGTFRVQRDVISQNPDLVFIEYAINDKYSSFSQETAALQYETIVREIKQALPKCDIVTLLVIDQSTAAISGYYPTALGHETMAAAYNISSLNVGKALTDTLSSFSGDEWNQYFKDIVHPTDAGYARYFEVVREYLNNSLLAATLDATLLPDDVLIPLQSKRLLDGDRTVVQPNQQSLVYSSGWSYNPTATFLATGNTPYTGYIYATSPDAEFVYHFTGTEIAIFTNFYNESSVKVSIDGKSEQTITCSAHAPTILAQGLAPGGHTLRLKPVFGASSPSQMRIGAIFTRDATKQTVRTQDYYVSTLGNDTTNSGTSSASPLRTLDKAVELINASGDYAANIHIVDDPAVSEDAVSISDANVTVEPSYICYNSLTIPHTATITYTGGHMFMHTTTVNYGAYMKIKGPTIFRDLTLVDTRADGYFRGLLGFGYNVTLTSGVVLKRTTTKVSDGVYRLASTSTEMYTGANSSAVTTTAPQTFTLDSFTNSSRFLYIGGYHANQTFGDDVKLVLNSVSSLSEVGIGNNLQATFNGNVNIVATNSNIPKFIIVSSSGTVSLNGALQVVLNKSNITTNTMTYVPAKGAWYMKSTADDSSLDTTGMAGTFAVSGGKTAYVYSADGSEVYYSVGGYLTVPAGTYDVLYTDSFSTSILTPPILGEWEDDGKGTVTVTVQQGDHYYVSTLGSDTNNGTSSSAPFKTLNKAVEAINASGAEMATIHIIDDPSVSESAVSIPDEDNTTAVLSYIAYNSLTTAHTAVITYTGGHMFMHTSTKNAAGGGTYLRAQGPSVFRNITLVDVRRDYYWGILSFGHNMTFDNATIKRATTRVSPGVYSVAATGTEIYTGTNNFPLTTTQSSTITVNNDICNPANFILGGYRASQTFGGDVKLVLNNVRNVGRIYVGGGFSTNVYTYNRNVNIVATNSAITSLTVTENSSPDYNHLNGAFQVVLNNSTITSNSMSYVPAQGAWYLYSTATDGSAMDTTDTAGTFSVIGTKSAYAKSRDTGIVYYGEDTLTLPAGSYDVSYYTGAFSTSLLTAPTAPDGYYFFKWIDNGAGVVTPVFNENSVPHTLYVSSTSGSDTTGNGTSDAPYATLAKAVTDIGTHTGLIIISGEVAYANIPAHTGTITYKGATAADIVNYNAKSLYLKGPTVFEDITLHQNAGYKHIFTNGNSLTFKGNITYSYAGTTAYPTLELGIGCENGGSSGDSAVFAGGTIGEVWVGGLLPTSGGTLGYTKLVIDGSTISRLNLGSMGSSYLKGSASLTDVDLVFNSGTITSLTANYLASFSGALQVVCNNGTTLPLPAFSNAPVMLWQMYSAATDGSMLDTTGTAGVFRVVGNVCAIATDDSGKTYYSTEGILTVPEGAYTVTYLDHEVFTSDGTQITFNEDTQLDLETLSHNEVANKLFVGWVDSTTGEPVENNLVYQAGTTLMASYVDCDLNDGGDFYILGTQIRTVGTQGLRYIVEKKTAFSNSINVREYGTVVLPTAFLGNAELKIGGAYSYNGTTYYSEKVEGINTFATTPEGIRYTVCLVNIPIEKYRREYAVRGYIIYTDVNGIERTLYSIPYGTSTFKVARYILKNDSESLSEQAYAAISDVIEQTKENYFSEGTTDIAGTSADKDTWVYRVNSSGVYVREVEINTGTNEGKKAEIVQITDVHFNYCNENDTNETLMSTKQYRTWLANGASVPAAQKAMEYATLFDQTVITGDTLDYLSYGAMELTQKYIWDYDPSALIALGGHDYTQQMQGLVPNVLTLQERLEMLQNFWKHDIHYYSTVVNDKVMCVVLDNGQGKYLDGQREKLAADIQTAKDNGYIILIFEHEPISTRNPADTAVQPITYITAENSSKVTNFYNGFIGKEGSTGANADVYNLITQNADVIKGVFCGHWHDDYSTRINATYTDGSGTHAAVIPQYVLTANPYNGNAGHVLKITVNY